MVGRCRSTTSRKPPDGYSSRAARRTSCSVGTGHFAGCARRRGTPASSRAVPRRNWRPPLHPTGALRRNVGHTCADGATSWARSRCPSLGASTGTRPCAPTGACGAPGSVPRASSIGTALAGATGAKGAPTRRYPGRRPGGPPLGLARDRARGRHVAAPAVRRALAQMWPNGGQPWRRGRGTSPTPSGSGRRSWRGRAPGSSRPLSEHKPMPVDCRIHLPRDPAKWHHLIAVRRGLPRSLFTLCGRMVPRLRVRLEGASCVRCQQAARAAPRSRLWRPPPARPINPQQS